MIELRYLAIQIEHNLLADGWIGRYQESGVRYQVFAPAAMESLFGRARRDTLASAAARRNEAIRRILSGMIQHQLPPIRLRITR